MMNITDLPEDCLSQIMSLTTPKDVIRTSAVSKQFLSASVSDIVWDTFLPSDCSDVISRSSLSHDRFSSKKELFIYLSHFPVLLDDNTKSFALDKWSGNIRYMLGSRALAIIWGSSPEYWNWESVLESRFPECAVLKAVCWLDITGKIHTKLLSPGTTYGAYFVFKIKDIWFGSGFENRPVKVSVSEVGEDGLPRNNHQSEIKCFYLKAPTPGELAPGDLPVARDDGWMEIEMGRYQVGVNDGGERVVLETALKEVEGGHWKRGLVVHGIEVRPLS